MQETIKNWREAIIPWLLDHGIKIVFIAVAAWLLNKILSRIIIRTVRVAVVADENTSKEGERKREDTLIRIFNGVLRIVIIVLAVMMILQEIGLKIGPLIAGAGIIGLAVGFGGQYLIRDIISGFFLILENQYRIGDSIDIDGTGGLVEDPPQFLRVNDFADSAVVLKILGDTKPLKQWKITGELCKRLKIAFDREGIEIPFPQRVIHQIKSQE